jgi:6,7-dimethyl-8-ribityllumazine synthase
MAKAAPKAIISKAPLKINIAIVASRFNDTISKALLTGCLVELKSVGVKDSQITTVWVPGALEIPLAALKLAQTKNIDAVICLGAVIRGDTYHFEVVSNESARGMTDVSLRTGKPIINGVLTTDTVAQAKMRAQDKGRTNKGRDCAQAVLEMTALLKHIK